MNQQQEFNFRRLEKYHNKYMVKSTLNNFSIVDKKIFFNGVLFYKLEDYEFKGFSKLNDNDKLFYLNCLWNFYMALMD